MCGDIYLGFWGTQGATADSSACDANCAQGNCEDETRKNPYYNTCTADYYQDFFPENVKKWKDRAPSLVIEKILQDDVNGTNIVPNRSVLNNPLSLNQALENQESSNVFFNYLKTIPALKPLIKDLEKLDEEFEENKDIDRFINIDMNKITGDIYILLNGYLYKCPINNLTIPYNDLTIDPTKLENINNDISELYKKYEKMAQIKTTLDDNIIFSARQQSFIDKITSVNTEIDNLNTAKLENKTFNNKIKSSKMENTVKNLQYLVWIILTIISIIIVVLNFVKPDVVPINIVIIYIIFVSAILIVNRSFFKKL